MVPTTPETIWNEPVEVKTSETDFQKNWKPACFFKVMQEAAINHASYLGFDYHRLLEHNMTWVLSRMKIYFYRQPAAGDHLSVRTWPKGIRQRVMFLRDFQFLSASGESVASATSTWLLMDITARRILHPEALGEAVPDNNGLSILGETLEKILPPDDLPEIFAHTIRYSDVDMIGHTNNARFVDWISDCFPFETYQHKKIEWLQINFSSEVKPGERLSIAAAPGDHDLARWIIHGTNQSTSASAFEAMLKWNDNHA